MIKANFADLIMHSTFVVVAEVSGMDEGGKTLYVAAYQPHFE